MIIKVYFSQNRARITRIILLTIGSIVLGIAMGVIAYFVSTYVYYIFIFPLVVSGVTLIIYSKMLQIIKIRDSMIMASMGLLTGITITLFFYGSAYLLARYAFATDLDQRYSFIDVEFASSIYDTILARTTGSSSLIGYMKLRAQSSTCGIWIWLYWFLEVVIISAPIVWLSYKIGKREIDEYVNDTNPLNPRAG